MQVLDQPIEKFRLPFKESVCFEWKIVEWRRSLAVACDPRSAVGGGLLGVTGAGCSGWVGGDSGGNQCKN